MFLQNTGLEELIPQEVLTEDAHTTSPHASPTAIYLRQATVLLMK